jgi:hypothetical protein
LSYMAFAVPAMLAGLAAGVVGLPATAMSYGAILIVLAAAAMLMMRRQS